MEHSVITRTNETTLAVEVIALRDIHPGEEILNSYLDPSAAFTSQERRTMIKEEWNFSCACPICVGDKAVESDERREQIVNARGWIEAAGADAEKLLGHVKTLLRLYEEEEMIMPKAESYWLAALASNALGQEKQALEYAASARKYWTIIFGEDHFSVKNVMELERDPAHHPSRPNGT